MFIMQGQRLTNLWLLFIFILALLVRTLFLGEIPNGFHQDEAINGYSAYSILKTLKDEYGQTLPLFVRSLNDYRESLHIFLLIPFIKVFGLTEFAIRLPSALFGSFTVLVLYFLSKELFDRKTALLISLFLTLSPWHIQFSRIGYGAILVPFCFCLSLLFLLLSRKRAVWIYPSTITFGLTLYTYAAARVFVPLFLIGILFIFKRELWSIRRHFIPASLIFLAVLLFLAHFWLSPEGMERANSVGLINNPIELIKNYLSYYNPYFLFIEGDRNLRHNPLGIGQFYWFEALTIPAGLFILRKEETWKRNLILLWLLLYPVPAFLTAPGQSLRALVGVPVFAILSGYGFHQLSSLLLQTRKKFIFAVSLWIISSCAILVNFYFVEYPQDSNYKTWRYGMKEAITYANKQADCVIISNTYHHTFAFILFYTQWDPAEYQKSPLNPKFTVQGERGYTLGKYKIAPITKELNITSDCLFVLPTNEVENLRSSNYTLDAVKTIRNPGGKPEIQLINVQPR